MEQQASTPTPDLSRLADLGRRARREEDTRRLAERREHVDKLRERAVSDARPSTVMRVFVGLAVVFFVLGMAYSIGSDAFDLKWMLLNYGGPVGLLAIGSLLSPHPQSLLA